MDDDKRKMSEFELLFHSDREQFNKLFPREFARKFETFLEFSDFWYGPYKKCHQELEPQLLTLMLKQYPDFNNIINAVLLKYMNTVNEANVTGLMFQLRTLCKDFKQKTDIRQKYPKIDEWREFYFHPQKPYLTDDTHRNKWLDTNDEQWEKYKAKENRKAVLFCEWEQKRQQEYYDIVQPMLFKHLPDLNLIEGDFWVIYATSVRDLYEEWDSLCGEIETTIEYEMPPESINWKYEDWKKLQSERFSQYHKKSQEKRDKLIYGDEYDNLKK